MITVDYPPGKFRTLYIATMQHAFIYVLEGLDRHAAQGWKGSYSYTRPDLL